VTAQVEVPFAHGVQRGAAQGGSSGVVRPDDLRWCAVRALPSALATPRDEGWDLPVRPETPAEPEAFAFLGVRQQHVDVDVRVTLRAALATGEHAGLLVRQSEADHVRLFRTGDGRVVAVHR